MASESRQTAPHSSSDGEAKGFAKANEVSGGRLPFEPGGRKKATAKAKATDSNPKAKSPSKSSGTAASKQAKPKQEAGAKSGNGGKDGNAKSRSLSAPKASKANAFAGIPEVVSQRMARRMGLFCGIPTACGMLTFVISYFIVTQNLFDLPTVVVLLISLGFFGLGVLGLSYGALSASWDEERVGTWLGWDDFKTNFGRTVASWRSARQ